MDTADAPNSWYGAGVVRLQGKNNQITLGAASVSKILDPPDYGITVPGKDNKDGKKPNIWYLDKEFLGSLPMSEWSELSKAVSAFIGISVQEDVTREA